MKFDKTETHEVLVEGEMNEDELVAVLKEHIMIEAGIPTWTDGVRLHIHGRIDGEGDTAALKSIGFKLLIDKLHHRKPLALNA
jgi:hypothetical protein